MQPSKVGSIITSLVWPDLSSMQGVIAFGISAHAEEGMRQFTGQNGSITPQKLEVIIGGMCNTSHMLIYLPLKLCLDRLVIISDNMNKADHCISSYVLCAHCH